MDENTALKTNFVSSNGKVLQLSPFDKPKYEEDKG
jgi:hypothetical protein